MIKIVAIRVISIIVLVVLCQSLCWDDQINFRRVAWIMIYGAGLPVIWMVCDWLFGVDDDPENTNVR